MTPPIPLAPTMRCSHRLRVRWAEVDIQKIVFNAHYLMYFDTAMADYWRDLCLPYESAMHLLGGDIFLKKASVEYHAPARYDDLVEVGLSCQRIGTSSLFFEGCILRGDTPLVSGQLIYVYANATSKKPQPVPEALRAILDGFEAGETMAEVRLGDWAALGDFASVLRTDVFVQEQGIDNQLVWDDADASAVHAVVVNRLNQPVATGRLVQHAPHIGRIGRMAVHRGLRGSRLGRDVLHALLQAARARGDTDVMLHAQCSAEGFYQRQGFVSRGPQFEEAGVRHIEMALTL